MGAEGSARRLTMGLLVLALAVGALLVVRLTMLQVAAAHGAQPCEDCAGVVLNGVPLVTWLLPGQAIMAWWAMAALASGERGRRAQGGLVALGAAAVAVAAAVALSPSASATLAWNVLGAQVLALVLALLPAGMRGPLIPGPFELIGALFLLVLVAGTAFQAVIILAEKLDRDAVSVSVEREGPPEVSPAVRWEEGRPVSLPAPARLPPIGRFDPFIGPRGAPVQVVLFGDLVEASTRALLWTLPPVLDRYEGDVRFVFKPLATGSACNFLVAEPGGAASCAVAQAAICAHRHGRFWQYAERIARNPLRTEEADLAAEALAVGISAEDWRGCLADPSVDEVLQETVSHAAYLGIRTAPVLYIAGRRFDGAVDGATIDAAVRGADRPGAVDVAPVVDHVVPDPLEAGPVAPVSVAGVSGTIDAVRAGVDEDGVATSMAGAPLVQVSAAQAQEACGRAGARLCTTAEWLTACRGVPVSPEHVADGFYEGRTWFASFQPHRLAPRAFTGEEAAARTPEGLADLVLVDLGHGVPEWALGSDGVAHLVGPGDVAGLPMGCLLDSVPGDLAGFRCCDRSGPAATGNR